jgi:hypothetical protein
MRVAVIGGHDRMGTTLRRVADELGHDLDFHPGHASGRGAQEIRSLVARAQLVFVQTDLNSHNAVHIARAEAERLGRAIVLVKRLGLHTLRDELIRRTASATLPLAG